MNARKAFAGAVVMVVMLLVHTGLSWAQRSDEERLRQLEKELDAIRQELEEVKKQRIEPPPKEGVKLPSFGPIQFGASITVRYDLTDIEDRAELRLDNSQDGFRTRDRFWAEFLPDGPVQSGLRISTATSNPTASFIRMGDTFRADSFDLDLYYINLRPIKFFDQEPFAEHPFQVSLITGKMSNPYWTGSRGTWRSEMVWDVDVNPEGVAVKLAMPKALPFLGLESTISYFVINEVDDALFAGLTGDTYLVMAQLKADIPYAIFAFTFYDYERLNAGLRAPDFLTQRPGQSAILLREGLQRTNNRLTLGRDINNQPVLAFLEDDFQVINLAAQIYYALPFPTLAPEIWFHGEYMHNLSVDQDENGFGVTIGLRGGGKGSILSPFSLWFTYRDVEEDATLATFADGNLGAGTGYKGIQFGVNYRFHPNFLFQVTLNDFQGFPDKDNHVRRVFFDLVVSF